MFKLYQCIDCNDIVYAAQEPPKHSECPQGYYTEMPNPKWESNKEKTHAALELLGLAQCETCGQWLKRELPNLHILGGWEHPECVPILYAKIMGNRKGYLPAHTDREVKAALLKIYSWNCITMHHSAFDEDDFILGGKISRKGKPAHPFAKKVRLENPWIVKEFRREFPL